MLTWLSRFLQYVSKSLCPLKFVTAALFAKLASLCLPSVSLTRPLSPLLSPCSCLQLLLGLVSSSAPPCSTAESSWVLLFWKECARMWLPKSLSGDLGGQSPKMWFRTSFGPRLHLVAAWSAAVVACAAASGQGTVFGRRTKRFVKGWKLYGRNQKHKKITWKKSIRSAVCHGEVDERIDWHEAEFIIETTGMWRFVGWKCHEAWCAMRRMIADSSDCSSRHMAANFWLSSVH